MSKVYVTVTVEELKGFVSMSGRRTALKRMLEDITEQYKRWGEEAHRQWETIRDKYDLPENLSLQIDHKTGEITEI